MEPTPRSLAWSWAGWARDGRAERRRVRIALHEPRRDWQLPQVPLYTPNQIRHLIRLETALGRMPTPPPDHHHRLNPNAYWQVHDFIQNVRLERPGVSDASLADGPGVPGGPAGRARAWDSAAWGWAAGALLLAALVLLVRALERYLSRMLFKDQYGTELGPPPRLSDSDSFPTDGRESNNDLPPPYSECANPDLPSPTIDPNKPTIEEPPPPYSACYFSNPKDGIPTVHFSRRNENSEPGSSMDTNEEPNASNTENKVTNIGCQVNVSLENNLNRNEVVPNDVTSAVVDAETEQVYVRCHDESINHVVEIPVVDTSQERVVTV